MGRSQPRWVHIGADPRDLRKGSVNFIVASHAELSRTNYPLLTSADPESVCSALLSATMVVPTIKVMKAMDFVNEVSKPSVLNGIQTHVYKIQPYSLRKEVQGLIIGYFQSKVSKQTMTRSLQRSFKTEPLIPLLLAAANIRDAVAMLKGSDVDTVSQLTGVQTFELLYLSKDRIKK
jgi:hypothetical protein